MMTFIPPWFAFGGFFMSLPRLVSAVLLMFSYSFVPMVAAAATEPLSGVPLFPGAKPGDTPRTQVHCGITMRSVQYDVENSATKPVDFFRKALPGASNWTVANGYMTAFLTPNGKAIVKIVSGAPGFYTIVYGSYSKPVTVSQVRKGTC
jgi:hypothetical protein